MNLPPFDEFRKTLISNNQDSQDEESMTDIQKNINALNNEIIEVSLNHLECYHNWLSEHLK